MALAHCRHRRDGQVKRAVSLGRRGAAWLPYVLALLPLQASAASPAPAWNGARSLAMGGAQRGMASSNEILWLNPAGMALTKHYEIALLYDSGSVDRLQHATASVVDSQSNALAVGVSYSRDWGNPSGLNAALNRSHVSAAYLLGNLNSLSAAFGATVHNILGEFTADADDPERQKISRWNASLAASLNLASRATLALVWHNALPSASAPTSLLPPLLAFGSGLHLERCSLGLDVTYSLDKTAPAALNYHVGTELRLFDLLALRGGWRLQDVEPSHPWRWSTPAHYLSGGLALINHAYGLNLALERRLRPTPSTKTPWSLLAALQIFL